MSDPVKLRQNIKRLGFRMNDLNIFAKQYAGTLYIMKVYKEYCLRYQANGQRLIFHQFFHLVVEVMNNRYVVTEQEATVLSFYALY